MKSTVFKSRPYRFGRTTDPWLLVVAPVVLIASLTCDHATAQVAAPDARPKSTSAADTTDKALAENSRFACPESAKVLQSLRKKLPALWQKKLASLPTDARTELQQAMSEEPFADQSKNLLGIWHGQFAEEPGGPSAYWVFERRADGTLRQLGIDLVADEKEYVPLDRSAVWMTKGRALIEADVTDEQELTIFIITQIDPQKVTYRMLLDGDLDSEDDFEWTDETDQRGDAQIPKPPAGWTNAAE